MTEVDAGGQNGVGGVLCPGQDGCDGSTGLALRPVGIARGTGSPGLINGLMCVVVRASAAAGVLVSDFPVSGVCGGS